MKFKNLFALLTGLTILATLSFNCFSQEVSVKVEPYFNTIFSGELSSTKRSFVNERQDLKGYGLGLMVGAIYYGVSLGLDNMFTNLQTKNVSVRTSLDGDSLQGHHLGPYLGYEYLNIRASASFYIINDSIAADNASYSESGGGYKLSLGYVINGKVHLALTYGEYEGLNSDTSDNDFRIIVDKLTGVSVGFPIEVF